MFNCMAVDHGLIDVSNKVIKSKNVLYKPTKIMMSVLNGLYTSRFSFPDNEHAEKMSKYKQLIDKVSWEGV